MTDLTELKQAARIVQDEKGQPVVQIPLTLWEEVIGPVPESKGKQSQVEQINALLQKWRNEPDDRSDEWWEAFEQFLNDSRLNFPERDLGLDDK